MVGDKENACLELCLDSNSMNMFSHLVLWLAPVLLYNALEMIIM